MHDLFGEIVKNIVAFFVTGIIAFNGIFSHELIQFPASVQMPAEQKNETSSVAKIKPAEPKKIILPENKVATTTKPMAINTSTPPSQKIPQFIPDNQNTVVVATTTNVRVPSLPAQENNLVVASSSAQLPPEIQIDPETFVGILCYFNTTLTNPFNGTGVKGEQLMVRGSGVIVNSQGYILTNKHIVVHPKETATTNFPDGSQTQININYQLDHCDVGQVPKGTHLPTVDEIMTVNPTIRINVLGYTSQLAYLSSVLPLSYIESQYTDFAILRITGVSKDGPSFGFSSVPPSFPYAKLLPTQEYNIDGNRVVTYGFPGDVSAGQNDAFQTLTMVGGVGNVSSTAVGDQYYSDVPLVIFTNLEISRGRSGSPLFWRGYVIGLTTFYMSSDKTHSGSVASDAIIKGLNGTGYLGQ